MSYSGATVCSPICSSSLGLLTLLTFSWNHESTIRHVPSTSTDMGGETAAQGEGLSYGLMRPSSFDNVLRGTVCILFKLFPPQRILLGKAVWTAMEKPVGSGPMGAFACRVLEGSYIRSCQQLSTGKLYKA